ncbi:C4-dicarboxylate ABC transporter [Rhodobacterales bacterium 59_46_T64]|nr:C4-dicarboxylate ABC transporter [Rhodobacterales bacterium 59_46_T64]
MKILKTYIRVVDAVNYRIGRMVMYGIFVLMGILLWSSISKSFFLPSLWTLEMAQFVMVGYYILGGPYSLQMGSNVRMDLLYGEWTPRRKAGVDCLTVLFLIFYLGVLLKGGIDSTAYSFKYGGERSPSAWRPYLWPIKVTMCIGIGLMLLQALSELAKDILRLRGQWDFEGEDATAERADAL